MTRLSANEHAARAARAAAIRACRRCDPNGWRLDADGCPVDPAVRCDHGAQLEIASERDITEPIHEKPTRTGEPTQ